MPKWAVLETNSSIICCAKDFFCTFEVIKFDKHDEH